MQGSVTNEADLIELARDGDVPAFEALYRMHSGRVYGLCVRLAASRAEAEDCTQETFITAWQRLADFRGDSKLTTWLHSIAYHAVIERKRRDTRAARHLSAVEAAGHSEKAPDSSEFEELEHAISRLPARAREAVVLQKIYGYTHQEAGQIMGITTGACKAQVHRALKLLAAALPADESPEGGNAAESESQ